MLGLRAMSTATNLKNASIYPKFGSSHLALHVFCYKFCFGFRQ